MALILAFVLTAVLAAGVGAYAGSGYGTESDPLVTLSYLDKVLTPELMGEFQEKLSEAVEDLEEEFAGGGGAGSLYSVVTLDRGQGLVCQAGCELLLRRGSASSISSELIDATGGGTLEPGSALQQNHLYLVTSDNCGISAQEAETLLLVRGPYTIA